MLSAASFTFINALLWPNGTVKSPSDAHFRNLPEVAGHPGTSHLMFSEYSASPSTTLLADNIVGKSPTLNALC